MKTTFCKGCGAEVIWCKTERGGNMPVDAYPVPHGNLLVEEHAEGLSCRVVDAHEEPAGAGNGEPQPRYVSHFANCPQHAQFRTRRRR